MAPRPSFINAAFAAIEGNPHAKVCKIEKDNGAVCNTVVKMGKSKVGPANLKTHAKNHHPVKYKQMVEKDEQDKKAKLALSKQQFDLLQFQSISSIDDLAKSLNPNKPVPIFSNNWKKQLTLESCFKGQRPLEVSDPSIQKHHFKFCEMILGSTRPMDLCNDIGLGRLLHSFHNKYILPSADYLNTHILPVIETKVNLKKKGC